MILGVATAGIVCAVFGFVIFESRGILAGIGVAIMFGIVGVIIGLWVLHVIVPIAKEIFWVISVWRRRAEQKKADKTNENSSS